MWGNGDGTPPGPSALHLAIQSSFEGTVPRTNLYLITYDISDDGDRSRCSQLLQDLGGRRINLSVFELLLAPGEEEKLMVRLAEMLDPACDSVACYLVCQACYGRAWWWPEGPGPWPGSIRSV
ncbi:MAG: CRISPR-associated endonuclease Cas2 [Bacteroidetes bacterium]|nr:MAG: CRISPR-associated endonuclease Cas2 [Bacteroidota bacterium]